MIRLVLALGLIAAAALASLATVSFAVSEDEVRAAVAARVRVLTGYEVVAGAAEVDLFPGLRFRLDSVELRVPSSDESPPLARMEAVSGTLRLWPLITGRADVEAVTLHRPRFMFRVDRDGERNWLTEQGLIETAVIQPGLLPLADIPLGDVRLEQASVLYIDRRQGIRRQASAIDATVSWPHLGAALSATGSMEWRGEATRFAVSVQSPLSLLGSGTSPLQLSAGSRLGETSFFGQAAQPAGLRLNGRMSLSSSDAAAFLRWAGADVPIEGPPHTATLGAALSLVGGEATMSDVALVLDGNSAEGTLSADLRAERPNLQGTLAFGALDLNTFRPAPADDTTAGDAQSLEQDAPSGALDFSNFQRLSADVRVSASSVAYGPIALGQTAATLTIRDGRLTLGIGQTELFGGTGIGTLTASQRPEGPHVRLSLSARRLDMAAVTSMAGAEGRFSGTGDATLDVNGTGNSHDEILADLTGEASIHVTSGTMGGLSAADLLSALQTGRPPSPDADRDGTGFDRFAAGFSIAAGVASTRNLLLESPEILVEAEADIDLSAARVAGTGLATVKTGEDSGDDAAPFVIEGPLRRPLIYPDPDWLRRRGGPPLDALIEGLIDRLR